MANSDQTQDSAALQDRLIELETRQAFLEQTVDDLNEVITEQQQRVALLEGALKHLNTRLEQMGGGVKPQEDETPPPHY